MIEVGTKIVGNWGAGHSYSYGVVTDTYEFRGRKQVVVDFDDLDVVTPKLILRPYLSSYFS